MPDEFEHLCDEDKKDLMRSLSVYTSEMSNYEMKKFVDVVNSGKITDTLNSRYAYEGIMVNFNIIYTHPVALLRNDAALRANPNFEFTCQSAAELRKATNKLDSEIMERMEKSHDYKMGYWFLLTKSRERPHIDDYEYFKFLERFKTALEKTKFVRSFKDLVSLSAYSDKTVSSWKDSNSSRVTTHFNLPVSGSVEDFIRFMSEKPDEEPALLKE